MLEHYVGIKNANSALTDAYQRNDYSVVFTLDMILRGVFSWHCDLCCHVVPPPHDTVMFRVAWLLPQSLSVNK